MSYSELFTVTGGGSSMTTKIIIAVLAIVFLYYWYTGALDTYFVDTRLWFKTKFSSLGSMNTPAAPAAAASGTAAFTPRRVTVVREGFSSEAPAGGNSDWSEYVKTMAIEPTIVKSHQSFTENQAAKMPRNAALTVMDNANPPVKVHGFTRANYTIPVSDNARQVPTEYQDQLPHNCRPIRW